MHLIMLRNTTPPWSVTSSSSVPFRMTPHVLSVPIPVHMPLRYSTLCSPFPISPDLFHMKHIVSIYTQMFPPVSYRLRFPLFPFLSDRCSEIGHCVHKGTTHELKPSPFCFPSAPKLFRSTSDPLPLFFLRSFCNPHPSRTCSITVYSDFHSFTQNARLWQDHLCFMQCWHRCSLDGSLPTSTYKFLFFRTHSQLPFQCFHFRSESCSHHQIVFHSLPVHFRKFLRLRQSFRKSL